LDRNPSFGLKILTRKHAKNDILYNLCIATLRFSLLAQIFWRPVAIQNGDLLAPSLP
jgi:hypothetical protein